MDNNNQLIRVRDELVAQAYELENLKLRPWNFIKFFKAIKTSQAASIRLSAELLLAGHEYTEAITTISEALIEADNKLKKCWAEIYTVEEKRRQLEEKIVALEKEKSK